MLSISLGPLALPVAPLLLFGAVWLASWVATRRAARLSATDSTTGPAAAAGNAVFAAALLGLLAARAGYLLREAPSYLESPWSALDLRDGGWLAGAGFAAAAAWLLWRGWRRPALRQALAAGAVAGAALWLAGTAATRWATPAALPALALLPLDGGPAVGLAQAAGGRPAVVNLWASWCGPCRQEMPVLAAAQQREAGLAFLFVNQGESAQDVHRYLDTQGLALRGVLLDPASALGPAVGSSSLPTTLFYGADGRLVEAHVGVLNAAALAGRLRTLR